MGKDDKQAKKDQAKDKQREAAAWKAQQAEWAKKAREQVHGK